MCFQEGQRFLYAHEVEIVDKGDREQFFEQHGEMGLRVAEMLCDLAERHFFLIVFIDVIRDLAHFGLKRRRGFFRKMRFLDIQSEHCIDDSYVKNAVVSAFERFHKMQDLFIFIVHYNILCAEIETQAFKIQTKFARDYGANLFSFVAMDKGMDHPRRAYENVIFVHHVRNTVDRNVFGPARDIQDLDGVVKMCGTEVFAALVKFELFSFEIEIHRDNLVKFIKILIKIKRFMITV